MFFWKVSFSILSSMDWGLPKVWFTMFTRVNNLFRSQGTVGEIICSLWREPVVNLHDFCCEPVFRQEQKTDWYLMVFKKPWRARLGVVRWVRQEVTQDTQTTHNSSNWYLFFLERKPTYLCCRENEYWSNYSDLIRPHPKLWFSKGNSLISGKHRLVKYYNLARMNWLWSEKWLELTR